MGDLRDEMNETLGSLADTLDSLVVDLDALAEDLRSLNDVVMGANNFTKCVSYKPRSSQGIVAPGKKDCFK